MKRHGHRAARTNRRGKTDAAISEIQDRTFADPETADSRGYHSEGVISGLSTANDAWPIRSAFPKGRRLCLNEAERRLRNRAAIALSVNDRVGRSTSESGPIRNLVEFERIRSVIVPARVHEPA